MTEKCERWANRVADSMMAAWMAVLSGSLAGEGPITDVSVSVAAPSVEHAEALQRTFDEIIGGVGGPPDPWACRYIRDGSRFTLRVKHEGVSPP